MPSAWRWVMAPTLAAALVLGACASSRTCAPVPPSADCPDLTVYRTGYNEWQEFYGPPITQLQEYGDATYPACNVKKGCPGSEFDGLGSTDVWVIPGVDASDAVVGIRQNSDVRVIFVRVGVRPDQLPLTSAGVRTPGA